MPNWRADMAEYVALDVSLRSTSVHIVDERGHCLWRGKCATEPAALAATVRQHAPAVERVGRETGMLSTWLCHELAAAGLPVVCMDARQAKVKSKGAMLVRTLLAARRQLVRGELDLANQIRGLLKPFGQLLPRGGGRLFEAAVRERLAGHGQLAAAITPL